MNQKDKIEERLRAFDYDGMYPATPPAFHDAITQAGEDIARYSARAARRRRIIVAGGAIAAMAAAAIIAVVGLSHARPDDVAPPVAAERPAEMETVYASKDDPHYHARKDCPNATGDCVELPIETAVGFEKTPCPACIPQ